MRATLTRWATRIHKWVALIVSVQVVFWIVGGLLMTLLPIERVRGRHHAPSPAHTQVQASTVVPLAQLPGDFTAAALERGPRGLLWVLTNGEARRAYRADTGAALGALSGAEARDAAAQGYRGEGRPVETRWYATAPVEAGREGPLWRVDFDDAERTALYLDPLTGQVVSRRSNLWRLFDVAWRLHILDFGEGDDINNPIVVTLAAAATLMTLAGLVLLWLRLVPPRRRRGI